jgi:SiaC family regulatory phosphoprotein
MKLLTIAEGKHTPSIDFDLAKGTLNLKGKSIPENAPEFYQPLIEAITEYALALQPITTLNISLIFFNTSSSKYLLKVLTSFASLNKRGTTILVNWHHDPDDEDMLETANDLENSCGLDFKYVVDEDMGSY